MKWLNTYEENIRLPSTEPHAVGMATYIYIYIYIYIYMRKNISLPSTEPHAD